MDAHSAVAIALMMLALVLVSRADNQSAIGKCHFFANNRVECMGQLRCRPSEYARNTLVDVVQTCTDRTEKSNGTWNLNQGVIPAEYARIPSSNELMATCEFFRNGVFTCVGGSRHPEAYWSGNFKGSLNSAFDLGQDRWWFQQQTTTTTTTTMTTTTTTPDPVPSYVRPEADNTDDNVVVVEDDDIATERERFREPLVGTDTDQGNVVETGGDSGLTGNADGSDRSVIYTVVPRNVIVCEYFTNGEVICRNCTERFRRVVTEQGVDANRRDYNCTEPRNGPPVKRWNADNGILDAVPDLSAESQIVAATCIFDKASRTYECHGTSALCSDNQSQRNLSNKCLSGRRWTGDFSGDFSYMLRQ